MIKNNILFIGLDTHKTFTEVAFIEDQRGAKSIHLGEVLSNKAVQALRRLRLISDGHCSTNNSLHLGSLP